MHDLLNGLGTRLTAVLGSEGAGRVAALKQLQDLAYREASTMAYADAFRTIMVALIAATLLAPLLRKVAPPSSPPDGAH
jgi:DHA2 family multidrug resistance protein